MSGANPQRSNVAIRLPTKGSRGETVLAHLYRTGPISPDMAGRLFPEFRFSRNKFDEILEGLIAIGCAEIQGDKFHISARARRHFDELANPAPVAATGGVAGPAYRPDPVPLNTSRLRNRVMREGAMDYRDIPSLVGGRRIAHGHGK